MFGKEQCPGCNAWVQAGLERCPHCYVEMEPPLTYANAQKAKMSGSRIVWNGGHAFLPKRVLDLYEDYSYPEVGDIVVVMGPGGGDIFFELAAYVPGWGEDPEPSFLLHRIDPDNDWPKEWPVLDVDPEESYDLTHLKRGKKKA